MPEHIFNTVIIEDSISEMELLKSFLEDFEEIKIIGTANKVSTATNLITNKNPDIVFLDIQLFDKTGFEIIDKIKKYNLNPYIIYTTSHIDFAIDAVKYSVFDFILKPITKNKIVNVFDRLKADYNESTAFNDVNSSKLTNKIIVPEYSKVHLIELSNINFLETVKGEGQTVFHLASGKKIRATKGIGEFDKELLSKNFIKLNRSFTINICLISSVSKNGKIEFENKEHIIVSQRITRDLLRKLSQ